MDQFRTIQDSINTTLATQVQRLRNIDVQKLRADFIMLSTVLKQSCKERYNRVDKVQVLMYVTFAWAWIGLYMTKVFELFFRLILALPNSYYQILNFQSIILNTQGKKINIISVSNEKGDDITEKFRLFLRWYWENSSEQAYDVNSFDYEKYISMLGSSILYCSYLLQDGDGRPQNIWTNVKRLFAFKDLDNKCYRATHSDLLDREELPFKRVHFDEVEKLNVDPRSVTSITSATLTKQVKEIRSMENLIHAMNRDAEKDETSYDEQSNRYLLPDDEST